VGVASDAVVCGAIADDEIADGAGVDAGVSSTFDDDGGRAEETDSSTCGPNVACADGSLGRAGVIATEAIATLACVDELSDGAAQLAIQMRKAVGGRDALHTDRRIEVSLSKRGIDGGAR
jgi:hypothetical protein